MNDTDTVREEETSTVPERRSRRPRRRLMRTTNAGLSYAILIMGSVAFLVPFIWMLSTSLKTAGQVFSYPIEWTPDPWVWENYVTLFEAAPFGRYLLNTVVLTFFGVLGTVVGSSIAGYAFARFRFRGRDTLFFIMLSTMMVPGWATLIPQFILFRELGWLNTYLPLIIPGFFATPFATFLMRQFFLTISGEIDDAAKIDGAGTFRIFFTIVLPQAKPGLIIIGLFSFMANWNEFFGPLIYLTSQELFPISLGIVNFVGEQSQNYPLMMTAATLSMAPCLLLFFLAQRWFIQGVVITGVKG